MRAELAQPVQLVWAKVATHATQDNYNRGSLAEPESTGEHAIQSL